MKRRTKHRTRKTASRAKWRPFRRLFRWGLLLALAFYSFCTLTLFYLRWMNPIFSAVQIQRRIESILEEESYTKRYAFVPLTKIATSLQRAVIAAEDGRFYEHNGIDWNELANAMEENLRKGRLGRGGSTISQQLVKNLFLTTHRSVIRKGLEFTLVPIAEFILPKKRILELYLNVIEWGPGVYGAEAASRYHYRISASRLSREQAARLAACIPAPLTRKPQMMNEYSAVILSRMSKFGR